MSDRGPDDPTPDEPFGPFGGGAFGGIPFLGDLMKVLRSQGPLQWDAARQVAMAIASEGRSEANPDPLDRIALDQFARIADLHVADVTGLPTSVTGRPVTLVPVTRSMWASRALDAWRPLFDKIASTVDTAAVGDEIEATDETALFEGLMRMLTPALLGFSVGGLIGHLAGRAFGQYDLPIPRPASDEIGVNLAAIASFADDWSLPLDDLRMWVCIHEIAHHAVLGTPHVGGRLWELMSDYAGAFAPDVRAFEDRLGHLDPSDLSAMGEIQKLLGDPELLLGVTQSARQRELLPHLDALVAVVVGYVDHVVDQVGARVLGSTARIAEAARRRRVDTSPADRFLERLLGLSLSQTQVDRGVAFIDGVRDRKGSEGLAALWSAAEHLPTPSEADAPGLWLARIGLLD